jgi:uncharacterized iron-regulated membrane protein
MAFRARKLQEAFRAVHLWLGIVAGLFIVMMGLSGTIIVFRSQLEDSITPKLTNGASSGGSLAAVAKNLDARFPGARITRITFPDSPDRPLLVQAISTGQTHLLLFFDPSSGQPLGEKRALAWLDWIVDFHQNLFSGKTGRAWTGAIGVALFLLSASGLFSWLVGPRNWKRTLALPQKGPWLRVNFQTHKWAGLWVNALLIIVASTGMVLAWPDTFQQAIRAVTGEQRAVAPTPLAGDHRSQKSLLPLDEYVHAATDALPGGIVREIHLSGGQISAVSLTLWKSGDIRPKGGNTVLLDPASAKVISVERASAAPPSVKLVDLANAIHKTELGGLPLKLPWALLGVAPALLFVSGFGIWWQRRQSQRQFPKQARDHPSTRARVQAPDGVPITTAAHQSIIR